MNTLTCILLFFFGPHLAIDPLIINEINNKGTADILCILKSDHPDLSKITRTFESKNKKGDYVYTALWSDARKSQAGILHYLTTHNIGHRSFFIINAIHIPAADAKVVDYLSRQNSVIRLEHNSPYTYHKPVVFEQDNSKIESRGSIVQWGIARIKADSLWSLGIKGQGTVIGGEDTGVELHPLLKSNYRGTLSGNIINNNYNWHDAIHTLHPLNRDTTANEYNNPCGLDTIGPCDDDNHGTHTMGTMNANDQQIGVAPDAKWIACRCMERGWGTPASYIECFEWFLAPTDVNNKNPDPTKAPHVINNSWGCPLQEGCNQANFSTMDEVVRNLKAAGIFVTASAGNDGSRGCNSINSPAAIFEASFTVGASNVGDSIAGFSSRGTVIVDSSNRIKPNIVAPGVSTLSTIRNGGFGIFQGTSMAGPHVAGAVALLISAFPALSGKVELLEDILEQSADVRFQRFSCGNEKPNSIPNNTYGYGILNVYKAYLLAKKLMTTGVNSEVKLNDIKVYPNPVKDKIYFETSSGDKLRSIEIVNLQGKMVLKSIRMDSPIVLLDVHLSPGLYYYFALSDESKYAGKIIIY